MSKTICLDAGHFGKYNQSPAVKTYYESDMNWKLHLLLKKELESYGFKVIQTRSDQAKDLELTARGKKARGCDLFLSLHSNAAGSTVNETADYVAVYHLTDDTTTKADEESKALASKIAPVIANIMGVKQGHKVLTRKAGSDRNGDGVMNDNYYGVLHGARLVNVPGLILEHSFHTHTKMTKWLLDEDNLAKLAKAEAEVIANHFGVKKEDTKMVTVKLPILKPGDKDENVKAMQVLLIGHGYPISEKGATGNFGKATLAALLEFKKDCGLKPSEECGTKTWSALLGV